MVDTNIKGLIYATRQVLPKMVQNKSGHIINIGSVLGHIHIQGEMCMEELKLLSVSSP